MPSFLHPAAWLTVVHTLPRIGALLVLLGSLSMMVFGLRYHGYYLRAGAATAGWVGGTALAGMMHVADWCVALPAAGLAVGLVWPLTSYLIPILVGTFCGAGLGTFVATGLELGNFWVAFAVGFFVGVSSTVLASRFTIALFCSVLSALGVVASLGATIRTTSGWLAPGGYEEYPVVFLILGSILCVVALVVQIAIEPDVPLEGKEGKATS